MVTMNELIAQNSLNHVVSEQNSATIADIGEAIRQVVNENFPQLRYPVIAGGAIRDTIFGLPIRISISSSIPVHLKMKNEKTLLSY